MSPLTGLRKLIIAEGYKRPAPPGVRTASCHLPTAHYSSSFASIVISALKRRETGQPALALLAAVSKAARSAPGTRAVTSRWTLVMLKPASVFSRRTEAVVLMESAVSPASFSCFERSEEHTSELQSRQYLVCRLLLEKKK